MAQAAAKSVCTKCDKEQSPNAKFCRRCGAAVRPAGRPKPTAPVGRPRTTAPSVTQSSYRSPIAESYYEMLRPAAEEKLKGSYKIGRRGAPAKPFEGRVMKLLKLNAHRKSLVVAAVAGLVLVVVGVLVLGMRASTGGGITTPTEYTLTSQWGEGDYSYTTYSGGGTTQEALNTFKTQMENQGWTYNGEGSLGGYSGSSYEKNGTAAIVSATQVDNDQVRVTVVTQQGGLAVLSTTIILSPSTFSSSSGNSTTFTATLRSGDNFVSNKLLEFTCTKGQISPAAGITDSNGQVSVIYTAPRVENQTSVTITVSFAGDNGYQASSTSSSGTIEPGAAVHLTADVTVPSSMYSTLLYSLSQDKLNSLDTPLVTVNLSNAGDATAGNVSVKAKISGYGEYYSVSVGDVTGGSSENVKISPRASSEIMNLTSDTYCIVQVVVGYYDANDNSKTIETSKEVRIKGRNSFSWNPPELVSAWVTPTNQFVRDFATEATKGLGATTNNSGALEAAERIFNEMKAYGITYITDAHTSGDYIQFPVQTLGGKSGDCDDLSILYSSLLESVGVSTKLILVPGHIFPGIILPDNGEFVPIEATAVGTSSFDVACSSGASEYQTYSGDNEIWAEIYPDLEHENGVTPVDITMSVPHPDIAVSMSNPSYYWSGGSARAKVTVTFTNNGDAPGMRGINMYAADNTSGNVVSLVGESTSYILELTQTVNADNSWSRDVVFAPGGTWLPSHINEIEVYHSIIQ